jgi:hypothetical protein
MIGLTVCVDYGDLLAVTLPRNARGFERVVVATTEADRATLDIVADVPNAVAFTTDAFTRDGATFNKGLAIEEAIEFFGRESLGWLCCFDADILMPPKLPLPQLATSVLYAPRARVLPDATRWPDYEDPATWPSLGRYDDGGEFAGLFLLFNSHAPHLAGKRYWFGTAWEHAGGYDSQFWGEWPAEKRVRMDWDVLHLGEPGKNWYGRTTPTLDGTVPEQAEERAARMAAIGPNRERHGYALERIDRHPDWRAR